MRCFTPAFRASPLYNEPVCRRRFDRTRRSIWGFIWGRRAPTGFTPLSPSTRRWKCMTWLRLRRAGSDETTLRLTSNDSRVPYDERNTAWKMVSLALEESGTHGRGGIHIDKRLPVQGGLGAGSGNAVAALVGLEAELGASQRIERVSRPSQSACRRASRAESCEAD